MAEARLSEAMKCHLIELLDAPHWGPGSPGEWAVARGLHSRGLVDRNVGRRQRPYSLNAAGRLAAESLSRAEAKPKPPSPDSVRVDKGDGS